MKEGGVKNSQELMLNLEYSTDSPVTPSLVSGIIYLDNIPHYFQLLA